MMSNVICLGNPKTKTCWGAQKSFHARDLAKKGGVIDVMHKNGWLRTPVMERKPHLGVKIILNRGAEGGANLKLQEMQHPLRYSPRMNGRGGKKPQSGQCKV